MSAIDCEPLRLYAPRNVWPLEMEDFSAWLARRQGGQMLAAVLGCDLRHAGSETAIAGGRLDLNFELLDPVSAKPAGRSLIVESVLKDADEDHFVRLLRYAVAARAAAAVLVAPRFESGLLATISGVNRALNPERLALYALGIETIQLSGRAQASLTTLIAPAAASGLTGRLADLAGRIRQAGCGRPECLQFGPGNLAIRVFSCVPEVFFQIACDRKGGWHFSCLFSCVSDVQAENLFHGSAAAADDLRAAAAPAWKPQWVENHRKPLVPRIAGPLAGSDPDEVLARALELFAVCNRHVASLDRDFVHLGVRR